MIGGKLGSLHTVPAQPLCKRPVQARFPHALPTVAPRAVMAEAPARPSGGSSSSSQPHGRLFNFSAGPAVLPVPVLEQAQVLSQPLSCSEGSTAAALLCFVSACMEQDHHCQRRRTC